MTFKSFNWLGGLIGFLCAFSLNLLVCLFSITGLSYFNGAFINSFLVLDSVSLLLSLISVILFFSLISWWDSLTTRCWVFIFFSVLMSLVCYSSSNMIIFWVSYELSILPLLYLLVVESPYSERFIASWYLGGYIVLTSVPMILSILYLGGGNGIFSLHTVLFESVGWSSLMAVTILCLSFITKIPLVPFHSWLPIVHAESSSAVSVCLSGFIMKLGVLGVFRFGFHVLPDFIFSYPYLVIILFLSLFMFFFSCQELDGKRWLAFLSLSHIVICVLGLGLVGYESFTTSFIFCLGHGFSAGVTFLFLWAFYNIGGSRNWSILKAGGGLGLFFRFLLVCVLCTVASFPTTTSFFSEIRIFMESGYISFLVFTLFFLYLFMGGLVPLFVIGGCLTFHSSVSCFNGPSFYSITSLVFLIYFCFLLFFLF